MFLFFIRHGHDLARDEAQNHVRHFSKIVIHNRFKAQGTIAQIKQAFRRFHSREQIQTLNALEAILYVVARKSVQYVLREFIGICRREYDDVILIGLGLAFVFVLVFVLVFVVFLY